MLGCLNERSFAIEGAKLSLLLRSRPYTEMNSGPESRFAKRRAFAASPC